MMSMKPFLMFLVSAEKGNCCGTIVITGFEAELLNVSRSLESLTFMKKYIVFHPLAPPNVAGIIAIDNNQKIGFIIDPTIRFEGAEFQPQVVDLEKKRHYEPCFPYLEEKYRIPVCRWEVIGLLFEEDLLVQIMAIADIGLPDIGDRVYRNMVRRYRVCVEVAGRHIKPFLKNDAEADQKEKMELIGSLAEKRLLLEDALGGMVKGSVRGKRRYQMIDYINIYGSYGKTKSCNGVRIRVQQGARQTRRWYGERLHAEGQRGCITSTRRGEVARATATCGVKGGRTLPTLPEVRRSGDIQIVRESYLCTPVEISRNYGLAIKEETRANLSSFSLFSQSVS
ncbi:hypothetical protein ANN_21697 [Periplaneta americana]|uniref:Per a allergen n=1 Tax=Periplaneta americana TaxID=6978 RepID=A0ABQ8S6G2_PERAM|nr:hypothetical protein ANN_21697 [Periplaneta americana]